jgi:hypothetical protein
MASMKNGIEKVKSRPIHSVPEFQEIIKKERSRSDRNNHGFSLIIFRDGSLSGDDGVLSQCIEILMSRTRISDEIGWYDEGNIGLLLPDTKLSGAHNLAEDIVSIVKAAGLAITYKLFVYPSFGWDSARETVGSARYAK